MVERAGDAGESHLGFRVREFNIPGLTRVSSPRPEVGAQCGSPARWDLCGGPPVRAVPAATNDQAVRSIHPIVARQRRQEAASLRSANRLETHSRAFLLTAFLQR